MAWPIDTKHTVFAAQVPVPSDCLNEMQDRIVDLHSARSRTFINGISRVDVSDNPCWEYAGGSSPYVGWENINGGGELIVNAQFEGLNVVLPANGVKVKWYIATAVGLVAKLYLMDAQFGASGTVPTRSLLDTITSSGGSPPDWRVETFTFSEQTLDEDQWLAVEFSDPDAGDMVAGVRVNFEPVTPT